MSLELIPHPDLDEDSKSLLLGIIRNHEDVLKLKNYDKNFSYNTLDNKMLWIILNNPEDLEKILLKMGYKGIIIHKFEGTFCQDVYLIAYSPYK